MTTAVKFRARPIKMTCQIFNSYQRKRNF